jgi:hypothetical protein
VVLYRGRTLSRHVTLDWRGAAAKWWLEPLSEQSSFGFNPSQRSRIRSILEQPQATMLERWYATFKAE